ncbi:hypothetical protein [Nitrosomonas supralitoralis]|nr:hypothetical protein [Nitrosomonas supralitoralis]
MDELKRKLEYAIQEQNDNLQFLALASDCMTHIPTTGNDATKVCDAA